MDAMEKNQRAERLVDLANAMMILAALIKGGKDVVEQDGRLRLGDYQAKKYLVMDVARMNGVPIAYTREGDRIIFISRRAHDLGEEVASLPSDVVCRRAGSYVDASGRTWNRVTPPAN